MNSRAGSLQKSKTVEKPNDVLRQYPRESCKLQSPVCLFLYFFSNYLLSRCPKRPLPFGYFPNHLLTWPIFALFTLFFFYDPTAAHNHWIWVHGHSTKFPFPPIVERRMQVGAFHFEPPSMVRSLEDSSFTCADCFLPCQYRWYASQSTWLIKKMNNKKKEQMDGGTI